MKPTVPNHRRERDAKIDDEMGMSGNLHPSPPEQVHSPFILIDRELSRLLGFDLGWK